MKTKKTGDNNEISRATLFVKGIPISCSNEELSEVFSQAGPVKDCFVVKYKSGAKNDPERPRIGYVTFMSPEDAKNALKKEKDLTVDGHRLRISFAKKKKFSKKNMKEPDFEIVKKDENVTQKTAERQDFEIVEKSNNKKGAKQGLKVDDAKKKNGSEEDPRPEKDVPSTSGNRADKESIQEHHDSFTVFVSGVPGLYKKEHALNMWKKCGLKEPLDVIVGCEDVATDPDGGTKTKEETGNAALHVQNVKFIVDNKQSALKACNKLAGKTVGKKKNYTIKATLLTPEGDFKAARRSRLIVRNVSFQCSENDLKKAFDLYGTITEVKIPTKPNGLKRGFAFVQYSHVFEAARAIKAMNLKEIKGRKVAIDWSLPKEKYQEMNTENTNQEATEETSDNHQEKEPGEESGEPVEDTSDDSGMEDAESESNKDTDSESEQEESENEDSDEEENVYDKTLDKAAKTMKKHNSKTSHDVHEGKTVFVMNLSYDTIEEQLYEALSEHGELKYAKIVSNPDTGMSKGCGFAQFVSLEAAEDCISKFGGEDSGLMIDGRHIKVVKAMSRGEAANMKKDEKKSKKKEKEDKRNLYLGREGLIRPGTQAAVGLSQIELKKREKIENAKRSKLRNPNIFVSKNRLCVHNLPKSIDEQKLRELALNQFKDKKPVRITECRVMRDMKNLNEKGIGRSLGYAFVNFAKHENALKALRSLNNNPDIFGPIKRPIVEFALENKKALEIKEQRKRKFQAKIKLKEKIQSSGGGENIPGTKKIKKIGRRQRQQLRKRGPPESGGPGKPAKNPKAENVKKTEPKKPPKNRLKKDPKGADPEVREKQEERKSFQGSTGMTLSGKKLPMPTHARPKIRQKNKGRIIEQMRQSKKLNSKAAQRKLTQQYNQRKNPERRTNSDKRFGRDSDRRAFRDGPRDEGRKRKRATNNDADFNALVAKYTKAIMEKSEKPKKTGAKWFE